MATKAADQLGKGDLELGLARVGEEPGDAREDGAGVAQHLPFKAGCQGKQRGPREVGTGPAQRLAHARDIGDHARLPSYRGSMRRNGKAALRDEAIDPDRLLVASRE